VGANAFVVSALVLAQAGCAAIYGVRDPSQLPDELVLDPGTSTSGVVGTALETPIIVTVHDSSNAGVAGIAVRFELVAGGGQLSTKNAMTDSFGRAQTFLTLGMMPGANTVHITAADPLLAIPSIDVTATALAGPIDASLSMVTANLGPLTADGRAVSTIDVTIVDTLGNPVAGEIVTLSASGSNNTLTTPMPTAS
jgi:hypothetical protein